MELLQYQREWWKLWIIRETDPRFVIVDNFVAGLIQKRKYKKQDSCTVKVSLNREFRKVAENFMAWGTEKIFSVW